MNIQSYGDNIYQNAALNGIVEVVAITISGLAMIKCGIKLPFALSFSIAGIFMAILSFVSVNSNLAIIFVAFGKFGISSCFNFVYVMAGEIFPTNVKNTALGLCLIVDRIGSIIGSMLGVNRILFQLTSAFLCVSCITAIIHFPLKSTNKMTKELI